MMPTLDPLVLVPDLTTRRAIDLYLARVPAGFPSPAEEYLDAKLDLNQHLIPHPAATFFVRASGESMIGAGIHDGDLLIVDRAVTATPGNVVIAVVEGELTVKRLRERLGRHYLAAENPAFKPIQLHDGMHVEVWGVVTAVVHRP